MFKCSAFLLKKACKNEAFPGNCENYILIIYLHFQFFLTLLREGKQEEEITEYCTHTNYAI